MVVLPLEFSLTDACLTLYVSVLLSAAGSTSRSSCWWRDESVSECIDDEHWVYLSICILSRVCVSAFVLLVEAERISIYALVEASKKSGELIKVLFFNGHLVSR